MIAGASLFTENGTLLFTDYTLAVHSDFSCVFSHNGISIVGTIMPRLKPLIFIFPVLLPNVYKSLLGCTDMDSWHRPLNLLAYCGQFFIDVY
jgi:hypothetical protein